MPDEQRHNTRDDAALAADGWINRDALTPRTREAFERCEAVAQAFHATYERLAVEIGYDTRPDSAVPWADVPEKNKRLMIATVAALLRERVIA